MSQDTAAPVDTAPAVADEGFKVFVGNLSFQTTKSELADHFSKTHPVLLADIITRNVRSLGYGFVAFETLAQAEDAVKAYNQSELGGRTINVEVAKPKVEHPPKEPKQRRRSKKPKASSPEGDSNSNKDDAAAEGDKEPRSDASADEGKKKGKRSSRPRRRAKAKGEGREGEEATPNGEPGSSAATGAEGDESSGGKKRNRRNKGANGGGETTAGTERSAALERAPRAQGPPSKTTVFVANLPFSMKDEGLKELFREFKVTSARVVRRQGSGRSKGYGFVELVDEAEQQRVLDKMKNVMAEDRELAIGVARSENPVQSPSLDAGSAPVEKKKDSAKADPDANWQEASGKVDPDANWK